MATRFTGSTKEGLAFSIVAIVFTMLGFLIPIEPIVNFYQYPVGTYTRPMGLTYLIVSVGILTPLIVAPLAFIAFLRRGLGRWIGLSAFLLSLLPLPFYIFLFHWIVYIHQLDLAE